MRQRINLTTKMVQLFLIFFLIFSCKEKEEIFIVAQFTTEKSTYYTNEEVAFTNTSTGGSGELTFTWDFGNGKSSTEKNPVTSYESAGVFVIKLTATDGTSTATTQKTLQIEIAPEPDKGKIDLKWIGLQYLGDIRSVSPGIDNDGNILMASDDHTLRKFSKTDGSVIWSFDLWNSADGELPEGNTLSSPSIDADGTVYIGTGSKGGQGRFYAISSSGTKKWLISNDINNGFWNKGAVATPTIMYLTAAIGTNSIFIGNTGSTGSVLAIDKATGIRKGYITNTAGTGGPAGGVYSGILLTKDNNLVWYGGIYGLYLASASQVEAGVTNWAWDLWLNPADQRVEKGVGASMAIGANGDIYGLGHFNNNVAGGPSAFAVRQDGTIKWKTSLNSGILDQGGVVIDKNGTVYVTVKCTLGESNGGLVAIDSETGTIKWKFALSEDVSATPAIDQNGNIHFGTEKGNYYIIKADGSEDPVIVKQDLTSLIIESNSTYAAGWVSGKAKCWSSPVIADDGTIYIGVTNMETRSKSLLLALKHKDVMGLQVGSPWPMKAQNRRHSNVQP